MDHSLSQLSYEPMFDFRNVCSCFLGPENLGFLRCFVDHSPSQLS